MPRTLLFSLSPSCENSCPVCPFRKDRGILTHELVSQTLELLEKVDEALVACNWTGHPELERISKTVAEKARKNIWLISFPEVSKLNKLRQALAYADDIVIVGRSSPPPQESLRSILSWSDARLSIWWVPDDKTNLLKDFTSNLKIAQSMGLRLIVGEAPYSCSNGMDPLKLANFLKAEVGLPMGQIYGYTAMRAYIQGYPLLLFLRPLSMRGFIYLSHDGFLKKHPMDQDAVPLSKINLDSLRRLVFDDKPSCGKRLIFTPDIHLGLREASSNVTITPKMIALLEAIYATNSLKAAAATVGIPYSTAVEKIKKLEKSLGEQIIETKRGGKLRGTCHLTAVGMQLLSAYREALKNLHEKFTF
ncbi:winged helix-turn-helix domain-containing protein [Infirmifilum sp.]|uniref:winged helix-turn-helix domain-containing protein n=1 Tax=Infirmifilum sp. TaxID=2856575 RepID=UPI003D0A79C9